MRDWVLAAGAALMIGSVLSAPAFAQAVPAPQQSAKPAQDPNQIVCEKQEDIGSRLASHRVCKTRAEWAEDRRSQRMDIEHVQTQRGTYDPH